MDEEEKEKRNKRHEAKKAKRLNRVINGESDAEVIAADIILSLRVPRPISEEPHFGEILSPGFGEHVQIELDVPSEK